MYFKQIDEIINGSKCQTRRVCKPGERVSYSDLDNRTYDINDSRIFEGCSVYSVYTAAGRLKWRVGQDYAVSPGRGKPGVWWNRLLDGSCEWQFSKPGGFNGWQPLRIVITAIRREKLQDISEADARAEGYPHGNWGHPQTWYREVWENINGIGSWKRTGDVWVLEFGVKDD